MTRTVAKLAATWLAVVAAATGGTGVAQAVGVPGAASAHHAAPAGIASPRDLPCGYFTVPDGTYGTDHLYNHCGTTPVKIQIDYTIGNSTQCVNPGLTDLGDSPWITNAFYIGAC